MGKKNGGVRSPISFAYVRSRRSCAPGRMGLVMKITVMARKGLLFSLHPRGTVPADRGDAAHMTREHRLARIRVSYNLREGRKSIRNRGALTGVCYQHIWSGFLRAPSGFKKPGALSSQGEGD